METRMIYICSPYAGNTEENTAFARQACGYAIRQGAVPLAPHLLYPQILNDSVPEEREIGIRLGLDILERCEELWICGDRMSAGMKRETAYAKARGDSRCAGSLYVRSWGIKRFRSWGKA